MQHSRSSLAVVACVLQDPSMLLCSCFCFTKRKISSGQKEEQDWAVLLQRCLPRARGECCIHPLLAFIHQVKTAWPACICHTHRDERAALCLNVVSLTCIYPSNYLLLPVHCSSIALMCSSVNFQNRASFFHSWGFNWLYARFQREERICLVCILWSCLKDKPKSNQSSSRPTCA